MHHFKSVIMKFFVYSIIILFVLLFYGFSMASLILLAAFLSVVTYVLGDLFVLPLRGNWIATLADGGLILLGVLFWTVPSFGFYYSLLAAALFIAVILAVCEWFLHIYIIGREIRDDDREPIYE
jgi:hypothetical protein